MLLLDPDVGISPGRGNMVKERDSGFKINSWTRCMASIRKVSWSIVFSRSPKNIEKIIFCDGFQELSGQMIYLTIAP